MGFILLTFLVTFVHAVSSQHAPVNNPQLQQANYAVPNQANAAYHARYDELSNAYTQGFRAGVQSIVARRSTIPSLQQQQKQQQQQALANKQRAEYNKRNSITANPNKLPAVQPVTPNAQYQKKTMIQRPNANQQRAQAIQQRSTIPNPSTVPDRTSRIVAMQQQLAMRNIAKQAQLRSMIPRGPQQAPAHPPMQKRAAIYPTKKEVYLAAIANPKSTIGDHPVSENDTPTPLSEHDLNINLARSFTPKKPERARTARSAIPGALLSPDEAKAFELKESAIARLNAAARRNTIRSLHPIRRHRRSAGDGEIRRHRRSRMPYLGQNLDKLGIVRAKYDYHATIHKKSAVPPAPVVAPQPRASIPVAPVRPNTNTRQTIELPSIMAPPHQAIQPFQAPMQPYQPFQGQATPFQGPAPQQQFYQQQNFQNPSSQAFMQQAAYQRRMMMPQAQFIDPSVYDNSYAQSDPRYRAYTGPAPRTGNVVRRSVAEDAPIYFDYDY